MDIGLPKGCAVRLAPAGPILGVAEGIETAASCMALFDVPTWALLNAENMKGFVPPQGVRKLIIFGDHDLSFTGQAAAFDLARKCWAKRETYDPTLEVEVRINGVTVDPAQRNLDWNDVWLTQPERAPTQALEDA
jgi:putative DNA primase/helicase